MCVAVCMLLLLPAVPGSGVRCGRVCWGPGFGCAPPPFGEVLLGCACGRVCAPLAPAFPGGPPVARGYAAVAVGRVPPPPLPPLFFWGEALWCRSLVVLVLGLVVSVPLSLLFLAVLFAVCVFGCFFFPRGVCPRVLGVPSPGGPLPPAWCCRSWLGGRPPFGGSCLRCRLVVLVGGVVAVGCSRAPPPVFFFGGVCLFLPLPSLGWRTHWSAFCVVFRFAVGGCALPGRAPAPWVGWVMYTLGSALLPAGLGSGSAGWAVVPGGFMCPWVSRVPSSPRCRFKLSGSSLCGRTATIVAGRAVALCRCVAGWWGSFRGARWLDFVRPSVSVPCLVFRCVVVRRAASCRLLTCCVVLVCDVLQCALLGRAVLRRVAPWCAALCRVVLRCTVVRCGAVCSAASCCALMGRWRLVWPRLWCGMRVGAWLVGGWGVRSGLGALHGPCHGGLGVPLGPMGWVGVRGVAQNHNTTSP